MAGAAYQLPLFPLPSLAHGREWITGYDSAGRWRFFCRPIGESGLFFNEFAGDHGEGLDQFGNLTRDYIPPRSYYKYLQGQRWKRTR